MSVRLREFKYAKDGVVGPRKVLVLTDTIDYIEGIDLTKLTQAEQDALIKAEDTLEELIKTHMTSFRRFKKASIS